MQSNMQKIFSVFSKRSPIQESAKKVDSFNRQMQLSILGIDTVDAMVLNLQHCYNRYMQTFDPAERKEFWRALHLMAIDLAEKTDAPCPEPEREVYRQLESGT